MTIGQDSNYCVNWRTKIQCCEFWSRKENKTSENNQKVCSRSSFIQSNCEWECIKANKRAKIKAEAKVSSSEFREMWSFQYDVTRKCGEKKKKKEENFIMNADCCMACGGVYRDMRDMDYFLFLPFCSFFASFIVPIRCTLNDGKAARLQSIQTSLCFNFSFGLRLT